MLLIITSNSDKLYTAVNVDDLEPSKSRFLVIFSVIFGCGTHFKSELRRNGWKWTWTTCV